MAPAQVKQNAVVFVIKLVIGIIGFGENRDRVIGQAKHREWRRAGITFSFAIVRFNGKVDIKGIQAAGSTQVKFFGLPKRVGVGEFQDLVIKLGVQG